MVGLLALILTTVGLGGADAALAARSATDIKSILTTALIKTAVAPAHQLELTVSATGLPPQMAGMFGNSAPSQEVSLVDIAGKRRGKDLQLRIKGALMTMAGLPAAASLEFIHAAGKSYIHGPLPMFGATENKWYVLDGTTGGDSFTQNLPTGINQSLDYKGVANADLSFLTTLSKQVLHGRQCDVYGTTDKNAIIQAIKSSSMPNVPSNDLDRIEAAEIKFWVCDDGYFHQAWVSIEGTTADRPNVKSAVRIRLSLFDYNSDFTIAAPLNPAQLERPQLGGTVFQTLPSASAAPASGPNASVFNGGNIRQRPGVKGQVLGQLHASQTITLLEKTVDGRWYLVKAPEATGWVHASLLRVRPEAASRIFVNGEASIAAPVTMQLSAAVVHGGNRRAAPGSAGQVLGQVKAGETIQLQARTRNGLWYYTTCRCGGRGWVHASLLKIEPKVARRVPIV